MLHQILDHGSISAESMTAYLVGKRGDNSVHIVTLMGATGSGATAWDGALLKLQIGATTSAGVARWSDIASTTLSVDGQVNVEVASGFYIRPYFYGMSAVASQSTSVDAWIAFSSYVK